MANDNIDWQKIEFSKSSVKKNIIILYAQIFSLLPWITVYDPYIDFSYIFEKQNKIWLA